MSCLSAVVIICQHPVQDFAREGHRYSREDFIRKGVRKYGKASNGGGQNYRPSFRRSCAGA